VNRSFCTCPISPPDRETQNRRRAFPQHVEVGRRQAIPIEDPRRHPIELTREALARPNERDARASRFGTGRLLGGDGSGSRRSTEDKGSTLPKRADLDNRAVLVGKP